LKSPAVRSANAAEDGRSYHRGVAELRTERLLLRQWREEDLEPFAALNADPETMRYFPAPPSREESDALAERAGRQIEEEGWGLWAVEVAGVAAFIGFVGLAAPSFEAHFTPAVEVGWRLAREHWRRGYATEAAGAALAYGFRQLDLAEIVSFTSPLNEPSWRVMERLGMSHDPADDFEHPRVQVGHPLRPHVLYRLSRADWAVSRAAV
jgi:RimJ/RimL family protein N-acetyltransferase